jgi:hypothetical protein
MFIVLPFYRRDKLAGKPDFCLAADFKQTPQGRVKGIAPRQRAGAG